MTFNRLILQFNPYHLVPQSPWPILVSFSLLSFTIFIIVFVLYSHFWFYYLSVCTELFRSLAEQLNEFSPLPKANESLLATEIFTCSTFVFNIDKYKHVTNDEQLKLLRADLKSVLVGSLLGDGYIGHGNSRFYGFKQGLIHVDYFAFIYLIFKPYLTKGSPNITQSAAGGKIHTGLRLAISTKYNQLLSILELEQNFYINKEGKFVKRVPEQIAKLMNPVVLAFLIQDDGHLSHSKGMYLNVQGYDAKGRELLRKAISNTFNIETSFRNITNKPDQQQIFIGAKEFRKVIPLIEPFFTKTMLYKLGK